MMKELFNQRVRIHQRQLQKYLRYIINDSFVVIMTFLFGGAVVYYTSFLKQLPTPYLLGQVISLLILLFALHIGKLATLLKPADQIFLLPKEAQMARYLQSALLYSLIVPTLSLALILGFLMPFIQVSFASSLNHYPWLLLSLVGLKIAQLQVQRYQCYQLTSKQGRIAYLAWLVSSLVTLAIALWFNHLLGLALAMLVLLGFSWYLKKVQVQMIFLGRDDCPRAKSPASSLSIYQSLYRCAIYPSKNETSPLFRWYPALLTQKSTAYLFTFICSALFKK